MRKVKKYNFFFLLFFGRKSNGFFLKQNLSDHLLSDYISKGPKPVKIGWCRRYHRRRKRDFGQSAITLKLEKLHLKVELEIVSVNPRPWESIISGKNFPGTIVLKIFGNPIFWEWNSFSFSRIPEINLLPILSKVE